MDREEKERVCVYGSRESSASVCGCECGGKFVFVQGIEGNNIIRGQASMSRRRMFLPNFIA